MSSAPVIQVDGLSKRYRLGVIGGTTLVDEFGAWWARMRGRPDPRTYVGGGLDPQRAGEYFWALRDVSFSMDQGKILGIIGRNGAGKSTLLKLLSRITMPTEGTIRMRGLVSSLLEVGTGFNHELTGRENIYLNGAILGMKKAEIDRKLQEMIAFSGIEHHIDTPTKRYSSGMKVRLGFAVAAHLEPEMIIIDEVLAVGDAQFQRKCLGKMKNVAGSGRTVLFVSHNMTSIQSLCTRVIWLKDGRIHMDGETDTVVKAYLKEFSVDRHRVEWNGTEEAPGNDDVRLTHVAALPAEGSPMLFQDTPFRVEVGFENLTVQDADLNVGILVLTEDDVIAFSSAVSDHLGAVNYGLGRHVVQCEIPAFLLNTGTYRITVNFFRRARTHLRLEEAITFEVHPTRQQNNWYGRRNGVFLPKLVWQHQSGTLA